MSTLSRDLRRDLERTCREARRVAEDGARKALEHLSVSHHEPRGHLTPEERTLRNRLRARARQLGDALNPKGIQATGRLMEQCAYEHWHRILFARFLAENHLLIHPPSGQAISLEECRELAAVEGKPWLVLASEYAVGMLPQVFRPDDAVLELALPPESRLALEQLLEALPAAVFTAHDSLGWTYQFWQAERKDAINAAGGKIGAEELGPVTQLFTEDYMVEFLLHNTIGAWWAGKQGPVAAESEAEARKKVGLPAWNGLPAVEWTYLRLMQGEDGLWRPAAGTFEGWPRVAAEVTMLDPCMGSGHFLVFALPILARIRVEEEQLGAADAVVATLRDNIHGLELDERCTQIAAFNLALAAWRLAGYRSLPELQLACSGLSISVQEEEWVSLAEGDVRLEAGMRRLHRLFGQAPILGSLIDPRAENSDLLAASFSEIAPLLEEAVRTARRDGMGYERAVTASGLAKAATILASRFFLVATNVPYLTRQGQGPRLREHCEGTYPRAKADLATCFLERAMLLLTDQGRVSLVSPSNWLYQPAYKHFRKYLLQTKRWHALGRLGPGAFDGIGGEVVNVTLVVIGNSPLPVAGEGLFAVDATEATSPGEKAQYVSNGALVRLDQVEQLSHPDARVIFEGVARSPLLSNVARSLTGLRTADNPLFVRTFWELPKWGTDWVAFQSTVPRTTLYGGREHVLRWEDGVGMLSEYADMGRASIQGRDAWTRRGVCVSLMGSLPVTLYLGDKYDMNCGALWPCEGADLAAVWTYCSSSEFSAEIRKIDQQLKLTTATLLKVPFDLARWREVAAERYPEGLPKPFSGDPTQWLFIGHPATADEPLHVGVARLAGYQWPRHTGSSFPDCPALGPDGLESHADADGIVCLPSLKGEPGAGTRLRGLLAAAYGKQWTPAVQAQLLDAVGVAGETLESWLQDSFFNQHCALFHQRPFVWHIWDGLRDGFGALVNYHKLAAPNGEGRRTLEKLTYTYLGDWIARQRDGVAAKAEGAELKLAAAEHLQGELEKILAGEPPYDIFVRWKPLHEQPIGWEPDINDGVRLNIRPFMTARPFNARGRNACILRSTPRIKWDKDRGAEPRREKEDFPWFWGWDEREQDFRGGKEFDGKRWNDLHYSRAVKEAARKAAAERAKGKTK